MRVLLIVLLVVCGFLAVFAWAALRSGPIAAVLLVPCALAAWGIRAIDRRREVTAAEDASAQAQWQGSELLVGIHWTRGISLIALVFTLVIGALILMTREKSVLGSVVAGACGVILGWFGLILFGMLYRAARAGYSLAIDQRGVHMPGWPAIEWSNVHGASVANIDVQGTKNLQLRLLLSHPASLRRWTLSRLLFGPIDASPRKSNEVTFGGLLFDVHEQRLRSAVRSLSLQHAPRFDDHWYPGKPLSLTLRSADERKSEQANRAELEAAGNAMMALARSGRTTTDPAVAAARQRLDAALARSRREVDALIEKSKALQARSGAAARVSNRLAAVGLIAIVAVLGFKAAMWYFSAR